MTDPNVPDPAAQPAPAAPAAPAAAPAPGTSYPGKTLGIVGLIASFLVAIVGLILSAIALSQSKKAGYKNTPAKVGLILGIIFSILWILFWVLWGALFAAIVSNCPEVAPGQYVC
ncbi:DUF4190 domain-containing protein [Protaetiibacter sp. SSC-01]|uniref:DUF4190 domain-containing protein n=1 Tax=Protaetiibacter sp. SSC-01 TaxID=2759943 RepID=UPI001656A90A|nr:DUF4190 domain-containing protein [Protaetiibacter sp. SSC-01]QNO37546.1 DUF4190 domain-containing protein [Protaetiibacter sp. SSC-01]